MDTKNIVIIWAKVGKEVGKEVTEVGKEHLWMVAYKLGRELESTCVRDSWITQ